MPPELSTTHDFSESQLEAYWSANTYLQEAFPNRSHEEHRRAAANLVRMGLDKEDFRRLLIAHNDLNFKEGLQLSKAQDLGVSIEQMVKWIEAPCVSQNGSQNATREEIFLNWTSGISRSKSISQIATQKQLKQGLGALVIVSFSVAATVFWSVGHGLSSPDLTETGRVVGGHVSHHLGVLKNLEFKDLARSVSASAAVFMSAISLRAWVGEKNKLAIEAKQVNLKNSLSQKQLFDEEIIKRLEEIPHPHTCLLKHLTREDLELFLKGDDVFRAGILDRNSPDESQRRQFAYLEADNNWKKLMLQWDVSFMKWGNEFSDTGSKKTLAQMRQERKRKNMPHSEPLSLSQSRPKPA